MSYNPKHALVRAVRSLPRWARAAFIASLGASMAAGIGLAAAGGSASIIGDPTSNHLAGYQVAHNGGDRFRDVHANVTVPDESSASPAVPGDQVVVGIALQQSVNGGDTIGLGFVWNSSATDTNGNGCANNTWTLEWGAGHLGLTGPDPLPVSDLNVVDDGGLPVCLTSGSKVLDLYYNHLRGFVHVGVGDTPSTTDTVVDTNFSQGQGGDATAFDIPAFDNFFTAGAGIDTQACTPGTLCPTAADDISGLAGSFATYTVTQYNGHRRLADMLNTVEFVGTESGGPVSVSNPETLTPSPLTSGFSITAP